MTVWVSDHGAKRLFAYRLEGEELTRNRDEEFGELSQASNNSPRGIWSDGDFMYVADESDDRVYTYNMPDAIDARLASLTLSGVEFGEFDPGRTDYEAVVADGVTETTVVTAEAMQRRTDIAIDPPDADGNEANGHQVDLSSVSEVTITVTSADGSRTRVYRVALEAPPVELALTPRLDRHRLARRRRRRHRRGRPSRRGCRRLPVGRGHGGVARLLPWSGGCARTQHPHDPLRRRHLLGRRQRAPSPGRW